MLLDWGCPSLPCYCLWQSATIVGPAYLGSVLLFTSLTSNIKPSGAFRGSRPQGFGRLHLCQPLLQVTLFLFLRPPSQCLPCVRYWWHYSVPEWFVGSLLLPHVSSAEPIQAYRCTCGLSASVCQHTSSTDFLAIVKHPSSSSLFRGSFSVLSICCPSRVVFRLAVWRDEAESAAGQQRCTSR